MAFWIGKGVFGIGANAVRFGEKIPASISQGTIDSLIKSGKVSEKPPVAAGRETMASVDTRVAKLEKQLEGAGKVNDELQKQLDSSEETVGELTGKLKISEQTVKELTAQIMGGGKDKGAGPNGVKK